MTPLAPGLELIAVSLVWSCLVVWLAAKLVDASDSSLGTCALLCLYNYLATGVYVLLLVGLVRYSRPLGLLFLLGGTVCLLLYVFFRTKRMLGIGTFTCILFIVITAALNAGAGYAVRQTRLKAYVPAGLFR